MNIFKLVENVGVNQKNEQYQYLVVILDITYENLSDKVGVLKSLLGLELRLGLHEVERGS
ncbi:hypothetical protein [uncultured Pseudoteredinibacter sp.]|uniref:hypothetical protein n=1 Tax=uncultured Pseudoteredinibacter sp. TaxID=1641701 RepID=UPI00263A33BF|nr:hypothetical protein [uncultured Pseudoteredinibacter sp.]